MDKKNEPIEAGEESRKIVESADHVGGINESVGGVDPGIDENLLRLSGGP